jgi:hypothetical protein
MIALDTLEKLSSDRLQPDWLRPNLETGREPN